MSTELTLTREDLYELVWSKPMVELAKDLGMSDVALAKRCRRLGVPVPGRGYWARVAAGQEPHRPKLAERQDRVEDYRALGFPPVVEPPPAPPKADAPPQGDEMALRIASATISLVANLGQACAPIQRLAHRERVIRAGDIRWACKADRQGPVPIVSVSDALTERALLVADALIRAAADLGWPFEAIKPNRTEPWRAPVVTPDPLPPGAITVAGEPITFRIEEPNRRIDHVLSAEDQKRKNRGEYVYGPRWDYVHSGSLCLQIHEGTSRYGGRTWRDGRLKRLEDQIPAILQALYDMSLKIKTQRAKHERQEREYQEQERLRQERHARRNAELTLIHELERQAGAWQSAGLLRRYLRAARRALGERHISIQRGTEAVDFLEWAQGYIAQLDPLDRTDRNPDLSDDPHSYQPDHDFQKRISRIVGFEGQKAWKITTPNKGCSQVDIYDEND